MVDSTQTSSSSSSSTPSVFDTPQSDWALQLSKLLAIMGQGQYDWAKGVYNEGKAVSDALIANFMQLSGQGAGLAQSLIKQYNDQFAPLNAQYIAMANSYNSEARQRLMAGQAESGVNQAMTAAADAAKQKLQSYGLNPADGRYQALLDIDRSQRAAAMAGAGQKAILDTADRGRAMQEKAIQFGQNLPGLAVNAANSAVQASSAAQNANLGQQNAGATLTQSAVPFLNAAAGANKLPLMGQKSVSGSSSKGNSNGQDQSGKQGAGGHGSGSDGSRPANPNDMGYGNGGPGARSVSSAGLPSGAGIGGSGARIIPTDSGQTDWNNPDFTGIGQGDEMQSPWAAGETQQDDGSDWTGPQFDDPYGDTGGSADDPYGDNGDSGAADYGSDPSAMPDGGDNSSGDWYDPGYDSSSPSEGADTTSYTDSSYDSGNYDEYAEGGSVPVAASPSRGRQTDDIPARLNAGEYVIPRDVVSHRGPDYFRNLIAESRRGRSGVSGPPPKAKLRPALNRAPSFVSR